MWPVSNSRFLILVLVAWALPLSSAAELTTEPRWTRSWPATPREIEGVQVLDDRWILIASGAPAPSGTNVNVHVSRDAGVTWSSFGNVKLPAGVRLPGHGRQYGSAVVRQADGVLRLLMSTDAGCLWEASFRPGRERWTGIMPAPILAGAGPMALTRLASGRVALAWIRPVELGPAAVWVAVSHNDTVTWTFPGVFLEREAAAGHGATQLSLREVSSDQVVVVAQGSRQVALAESDLLRGMADARQGKILRVVMMGDSITRGARPGVTFSAVYSERLREPLRAAGVDVHNVGIGAERTDLALERFEVDVLSQRPAVVTLMYGTNDSYVDSGKPASRLSLAEYRRNLAALITRARAVGVAPVLMTPPRWGALAKPNGLGENPNRALAAYVVSCRELARELDVPLVDHHARWARREAEGGDIGAWTTDQCHPNSLGHAELAAAMLPVLNSVIRGLPRSAR